ncbi:hypothetical protein JW756_00585 [Candidatus Woesearchaeota archaeon]|nr:hypothetical protein [Candidatus Woesearchaeota archaeon]
MATKKKSEKKNYARILMPPSLNYALLIEYMKTGDIRYIQKILEKATSIPAGESVADVQREQKEEVKEVKRLETDAEEIQKQKAALKAEDDKKGLTEASVKWFEKYELKKLKKILKALQDANEIINKNRKSKRIYLNDPNIMRELTYLGQIQLILQKAVQSHNESTGKIKDELLKADNGEALTQFKEIGNLTYTHKQITDYIEMAVKIIQHIEQKESESLLKLN